jgi:hypothetical protein
MQPHEWKPPKTFVMLTPSSAVRAIDRHGMLLVFPLANASDPASLWSVAYPKARMRWEWDEDADDRVVSLWHLRTRLARSGKVVYSKWFRGRATFFSLPVFRAMLAHLSARADLIDSLPIDARDLLSIVEDDSPISTKELRKRADLGGRERERIYIRSLSALFARLLIVGFGEVADGAFPSLAVGATSLLFEDAWTSRDTLDPKDDAALTRTLRSSTGFARSWDKLQKSLI